jgi:hypothetical protein
MVMAGPKPSCTTASGTSSARFVTRSVSSSSKSPSALAVTATELSMMTRSLVARVLLVRSSASSSAEFAAGV